MSKAIRDYLSNRFTCLAASEPSEESLSAPDIQPSRNVVDDDTTYDAEPAANP